MQSPSLALEQHFGVFFHVRLYFYVYTDIIYQESKEFLFCLWLVEVNLGDFYGVVEEVSIFKSWKNV